MHTGKNNPNYTHSMTGFTLVVIKQETLRLSASQYLQSSIQCSATVKKAGTTFLRAKQVTVTKLYYAILVSLPKKQ